jgi:hypothetical protein
LSIFDFSRLFSSGVVRLFPFFFRQLFLLVICLCFAVIKNDDLIKSRNSIKFVIPAKAGIQLFQDVLDPGFRRGDASRDFLRNHQECLDELFNPFPGGIDGASIFPFFNDFHLSFCLDRPFGRFSRKCGDGKTRSPCLVGPGRVGKTL